MTSPETPPPISNPTDIPAYTSLPPAGRRPWAASEIFCWGLVFLLCGLAAVVAMAAQSGNGDKSNPGFTFLSKYAVAVHEMNKGGAVGGSAADARLLEEVEKKADSPQDHLRAAIVAGEFQGRTEALRRLDALAADHPEIAPDADTARQLLSGATPEPEAAAAFRTQYGWIADLAQSIDKPAGDPLRAGVVRSALVMMVGYVVMLVAVCAFAGIGLILLIIGLVRLSTGKLRLGFARAAPGEPSPADRRFYLQGFSLYMTVLILAEVVAMAMVRGNASQLLRGLASLLELGGLVMAFGVGIVWPLIRRQQLAQWRAALGVHLGRGFFREVGSGIVGYVAGLPVIAVGYVITLMLTALTGQQATHPIENELNGSIGVLLLVFGLACVWAPVTEELMFRGALFSHLRERFGWWISAPVVACVFAVIHPQGWIAVPALASIAVVLAGIREWRGSIIGCMTAHSLHNAMTLAIALLVLRNM